MVIQHILIFLTLNIFQKVLKHFPATKRQAYDSIMWIPLSIESINFILNYNILIDFTRLVSHKDF